METSWVASINDCTVHQGQVSVDLPLHISKTSIGLLSTDVTYKKGHKFETLHLTSGGLTACNSITHKCISLRICETQWMAVEWNNFTPLKK
jgi:hypothetical protein